jgi:hypothetical protein
MMRAGSHDEAVARRSAGRLWIALLPELRRFSEDERRAALRAARDTAFDVVELLGMAAALVAVTALTRYAIRDIDGFRPITSSVIVDLGLALPLLLLGVAPFVRRRLRRGLRRELDRKGPR